MGNRQRARSVEKITNYTCFNARETTNHLYFFPSDCAYKLRRKNVRKIIQGRLTWYLETNGIFPEKMTGFRSGRSTSDSVLDFVSSVEEGHAENKITVAVFLDIK